MVGSGTGFLEGGSDPNPVFIVGRIPDPVNIDKDMELYLYLSLYFIIPI